jgi:hypothetical protein
VRLAGLLAGAATLAACAAGGFIRPEPEALKLGETTQPEVVKLIGQPAAREAMVRNGKHIEILSYAYVTEAEKRHGDPTVIASRTLNLFFHDERLIGHEYSSTLAADHTRFRAAQDARDRQGQDHARGRHRAPRPAERPHRLSVDQHAERGDGLCLPREPARALRRADDVYQDASHLLRRARHRQ